MIWIVFLAVGVAAGLISGLLGVGGGTVVVPVLVIVLSATTHVPANLVIKVAVATSFLSMVFTTLNSVRTHHIRGTVRWSLVYKMLPGLLIGTFMGGMMVHLGDSYWLQRLFAIFTLGIGINMLIPRPAHTLEKTGFNSRLFHTTSLTIGTLSGLFGIGGGTFNVPNLHKRGLGMIQSIATSAAAGWPIAIMGALTLTINQPNQPIPQSFGYIYLPAFVGMTITSVVFSGLGAKLAYQLPTPLLKKIFAIFLVLVGLRMLTG